jgi:hypothetical protein
MFVFNITELSNGNLAVWCCRKVKSWAPKLPIPYNPFHRLHIEEMPEGSLLNHQVHKEMRLTYVNNLKDGAWNFCVLVKPRSWRWQTC